MSGTTEETLERPPSAAPDTEPAISDAATVRDRVWDATLHLLATRPIPFQAWRVRRRAGLDASQDRTIRRTLTVMAAAGWLEHQGHSKWWYPGEKAEERFRENS
jgi:hypothetical protein